MFDSPLKFMALVAAFMVLWRFARNRQFNRRYATLPLAQRRLIPRRRL